MTSEDWKLLCRNIASQKCILIVGPELPITGIRLPVGNEGAQVEDTTISKQLCDLIKHEILKNRFTPEPMRQNLEGKDLHQLASDYIKIHVLDSDREIVDGRNGLAKIIQDFFFENSNRLQSNSFKRLVRQLPFSFIVDTNYTSFLADELVETEKRPRTGYYNFKGKKAALEGELGERLGQETQPFVYNLFGHTDDWRSMVFTENDLIEFVVNLIRADPGLPANVKSALADQERYYLFIGFGMISKNWYFRVLLNALESNKKDSLSYAIENITNIQPQDQVLIFFRDELKMKIVTATLDAFIDGLLNQYARFRPNQGLSRLKVFISYKTGDIDHARRVQRRLFDHHNMDPWVDRDHDTEKFRETLITGINETDAYVLLQSKGLFNAYETYVNLEIDTAVMRSKNFSPTSDFLYPAFIDDFKYCLTKPSDIAQLDSWDLTTDEGIDKMATKIKRNYERKTKHLSLAK